MTVLVICIFVVNIILWCIFLIRFKKLFSTDKIIETTTKKMNNLVAEIDKATERDLYLTKDAAKRIQTMLDTADQKMELFKEASQRLRDMIAESDKITRQPSSKSPIYQEIPEIKNQNKNELKTKAFVRKNINSYLKQTNTAEINPDNTYEIKKSVQQELFQDEENTISNSPMNVTQDGAAYREVPLIITKVYDEEIHKNESSRKKNLTKLVQELYNNGLKVEEIANELSCSITEVQLIIDMNI